VSEPPTDYRELPDDLPAPEDDGAADHLSGAAVPSLTLEATSGEAVDLARAAAGLLVIYVYPRTGTPGEPLPEGWDRIPGARGCTPQNCAFRDRVGELAALGATIYGLSAQPLTEQRALAEREGMPYPLLNDSGFRLVEALALPTFEAAGCRYYRRLTFVASGGRIEKVFYPFFPPQDNAADVIAWLRRSAAG
jgi:peroxiredoxin